MAVRQGGSFTISNLGMYGVDQFCAIINPPQASRTCCYRLAAGRRPPPTRPACVTSTPAPARQRDLEPSC